MSPSDAILWCREHDAVVSFEHTRDGKELVTVKVNRRHPATAETLEQAVLALAFNVETMGHQPPQRRKG